MLERILPGHLDNQYRGYRIALGIFGFIIAVRALQSIMIIFNGHATVTGADGIPLDAYPADAAKTVLGLFAQGSLWRLVFSVIGAVVLVRYRSAVPLMFAVLFLAFLAGQILAIYIPLVRVGSPPGFVVNFALGGLIVVGLALSLLERRENQLLRTN